MNALLDLTHIRHRLAARERLDAIAEDRRQERLAQYRQCALSVIGGISGLILGLIITYLLINHVL